MVHLRQVSQTSPTSPSSSSARPCIVNGRAACSHNSAARGLIRHGLAEQLRILRAAQGNPALLALATVDLAHQRLPAGSGRGSRTRWSPPRCRIGATATSSTALLDMQRRRGNRLLGQLRTLTVIEPFPARGEHAVNVHEATRLALREHLYTHDAARWSALATRARAHVARHPRPHRGTLPPLRHRPGRRCQDCEALDREFTEADAPRSAMRSPLPSGN